MVSESDTGREIVEVGVDESGRTVTLNGELGAERGCQLRVLSAGNDQRERVEIERSLQIVRFLDGGEEFVAETKIQGEARGYFEVVETVDRIDLAVIDDVVQAGNFSTVRNAEQEGGDGLATGTGCGGIVSEIVAEAHVAARRSRFVNGELFEAEFGAHLRSVASVGPAQIVGKDVAVLLFDGGLVSGSANAGGAIPEADGRQAAEVRTEGNSGKIELLGDVDVVIQVEAVGI